MVMADEDTDDYMNGITFVTAIEKRYIETCIIPKDVLHLPQTDGHQRTIELVGFEKTFERLNEVVVSHMKIIASGNDCHRLRSVLSQTKTLVLSNNWLTDWMEVFKIVVNMEMLTDLVLSHNKLKLPTEEQLLDESLKSIKTLIIDNINYNWHNILYCCQMWPSIERLDLWGNCISQLSSPKGLIFNHLNYLSLCNNNIEDWLQVCKLGELQELKTLDVSDCNLRQICFRDVVVNQKTLLFPQLEYLLISNNRLNEWRDIAELNKLQKLQNLFIKNNPVFDNEKYDTNFNFILSRIEGLKVLNRENISEAMRRDSEIAYLRRMYKENPTFESILAKLGTPYGFENLSKKEMERKKFFNIKLRNPFDNKMEIEKKIPASITIINLKTIVRKLFDIDYNYDFNLIWTSKDFECPLDKESQNLNYYSIENGDTILFFWTIN
ncbi:tubulin-specific chaperone E-like [Oppia nitens]|uniref:tubulin-specific chaperone E-like n=1 Tax=Oppia nitens TaxID=1686743 RepID=UPI0023DAE309|nr:tubulin-specific chaperone E-like [Oppia nitens]